MSDKAYDNDDFDSASEESIADETPFEVNVNMAGGDLMPSRTTCNDSELGEMSRWDSDDEGNDLELHGRGGKLKLSKKPPEVLLRQYRNSISSASERGEKDQVIEDLVRCTALARIVYGDCDWRYAESEAQLAKAYWLLKNMAPQAQQHAEEARNIMLRVVQSGGAQEDRKHIYRTLLSVYITLGEANNAQQKYTDGELSYQKAEKILSEQKKSQPKHISADDQEQELELKSELRVAQAKLAANQGKAAVAVAHFEEAISIIQEEYGDDSVKLIPLYQMLGRVEQSREGANHMKSIEAYLQAHSIANANYSEGTEELAETGYQLAVAYTRAAAQDKDAETSAESYLNECIATYQSLHGPNHEKTLKCQDEMARLMIRTERPDEALELLRSTLPARRETFGEYSQNLASAYKLLGSVHMSQGNMEKSLKSMNKELSDAEKQYRTLQQQHATQLQQALDEKEKQLSEGRALFDQLKQDFKYNLRLLQERDTELEQNDVALCELRAELDTQMGAVSGMGVKLSESEKCCRELQAQISNEQTTHRQQVESVRSECGQKMTDLKKVQGQQLLELESEKRALTQNLQVCEELRISEKREAQSLFEDQLAQRERDWRQRIEKLEAESLANQLRVTSLNKETEKLREDRTAKSQIAESSEAVQRRLENELKQCRWELEDYRSMCTRRIQDLEATIASSEQSQKALVEKYERKVVQSESRLQEMSERQATIEVAHNDRVNDLNSNIRKLKEQSSEIEAEKARLDWKVEDVCNEKNKIIESNALARSRLEKQIETLEQEVGRSILQEEIIHLKQTLEATRSDLKARSEDVEKYQQELVNSAEELSESERQRVKLDLDCQKKCERVEREQYQKSEKLIVNLTHTKERAEATIKRLEKEAVLHYQAISKLKKDRDDAYNTLHNHGITLQFTHGNPSNNTDPDANGVELSRLRAQNDSLKQVIGQMRQEMEGVAANGRPSTSVVNGGSAYVQSLEDEVAQLKQDLRTKQRSEMTTQPTELEIKDVVMKEEPAVQQIVKSLNCTISSLRSEKIELTAASRKQQIELERLRSEISQLKCGPRKAEVDLEQARYELNAANRKLASESSSLRQRIGELETQLESSREEAAEYHRSLLTVGAENQTLSTELSQLKISQARSGEVINYGAQELVIQNLQDENERLRHMVQKSASGQTAATELNKALARVSQLSKEKAILTELSNKLRAELQKAGINVKRPPGYHKMVTSQHASESHTEGNDERVSQAVQGKLDQLERLQYQLTKANINKSNQPTNGSAVDKENQEPESGRSYPLPRHNQGRPVSPPTKLSKAPISEYQSGAKPRKSTVHPKSQTRLPVYIEQSSNSSSSFKAKGKQAALQPPRTTAQRKYVAPPPKSKTRSNIAWMKKREDQTDGDINRQSKGSIADDTRLAQYDDNSLRRSLNSDVRALSTSPKRSLNRSPLRRSAGGFVDSMELGSSIQEVWKLLDNQSPSVDSSTPTN